MLAFIALSALADPTVQVTGICPGPVAIDLSGATPGGQVGFATSPTRGNAVVPNGPCAGTQVGLSPNGLVVRGVFAADGSGEVHVQPTLPAAACDLWVLALDLATCAPSEPSINPNNLGNIAVVGCSNTGEHAEGYYRMSADDRLAPVTRQDIGGGSLRVWAQGSPSHWASFDAHKPYDGVWFQICLQAADHNGQMEAIHQAQFDTVIDRIRVEAGNVPIWTSPLQSYVGICPATGPEGVAVATEISDWAAWSGRTLRGPDTGPVGGNQLEPDGCHLSIAGEDFVGQQMVDFMDGS